MKNIEALMEEHPVLKEIAAGSEVAWINPNKRPFALAGVGQELSKADVEDAENRLKRFAPFIMRCFPETADRGGLIESELTEIPNMRRLINENTTVHWKAGFC